VTSPASLVATRQLAIRLAFKVLIQSYAWIQAARLFRRVFDSLAVLDGNFGPLMTAVTLARFKLGSGE